MQRTREGKLRWEPTALENSFLTAVGGKYSITIHRLGGHHTLSIRDLGDEEVACTDDDTDSKLTYADQLSDLFDLIVESRRHDAARAVEGVLEALGVR
jgi:hypothetical protein